MSQLIDIDPSTEMLPEDQGCEFGYYLPPIATNEVHRIDDTPVITITNPENETLVYLDPKDPGGDIDRLLTLLDGAHYEVISSLQDCDTYCHCILQQIQKSKMSDNQLYKIENDILKCDLQVHGQIFYPIVLPHMLVGHVLELARNKLGHNEISRTYAMLKCLYNWKGMKASIIKHVKCCDICQKCNLQIVPYAKLHFDTTTFPMQFISMDLIGELYPPSKAGHRYALTVICMLTGYVFCIPKNKQNKPMKSYRLILIMCMPNLVAH